ncbi:MAG: aminoacyl-tRNA hydrolase, partial [Synechococcaceae bacterium WB9_4xC_028]|nr:aminoacyl-tRNA hydrolase [Synechococcaceae bacterium WB9_4xC_028]
LSIQASEHRSQYKNRCLALEKMAAVLREALKPDPKPRRATKPSKAATRRRLDSKKIRGDVKRNRQHRPRMDD